jgi:rod shape-determining protein MreD
MRAFAVSVLLLLNIVLSSTVLRHIAIFGVMPNIALLIVVSFSVLRSDVEGAIIGLLAGLLQDIMFGRVIGINALLFMAIGYICGKPFKDFYRENYLLPLLLVIAATFFFEFGYYVTNFLFRNKLDFLYYMRKIILTEMCYNAFLSIPVFRLIYSVNAYVEKIEKPRRKLF